MNAGVLNLPDRSVVDVVGVVLVVPTDAEVDFELLRQTPVVLDVEAEDVVIDVGRRDLGTQFDPASEGEAFAPESVLGKPFPGCFASSNLHMGAAV